MKKVCLAILVGVLGFSVKAQDISQEEVPDQVKQTFDEEYASAKDIKWKQGEERGTFEAEFSERGEEKEAVYDESGEKKMVMTEIKRDELPQAIQQTLDRDYTDYNLENFYRVEKEGKIKYKVKAEKDGQTEKLMFDPSGKEIKKDKKHKKDKRKS